jgi:hypothetical protein
MLSNELEMGNVGEAWGVGLHGGHVDKSIHGDGCDLHVA